jgi:hypothetical protein
LLCKRILFIPSQNFIWWIQLYFKVYVMKQHSSNSFMFGLR